jgi:predicted negative regulator of RcsB-dependent stress response
MQNTLNMLITGAVIAVLIWYVWRFFDRMNK